jgi:hypothetical protein
MPRLAIPRVLTALAALALGAAPALAQQAETPPPKPAQGAPKSLLPDEFLAQPGPAPGAEPGPTPLEPDAPGAALPGFDTSEPEVAQAVLPDLESAVPKDPLAELAGPTGQPELLGLLTVATGGYGPGLFQGSDARFLATLLGRIDAPIASRWAQIMLQRALLSRAMAPDALNPADWVAARGGALIAMGAGADAHRLVSQVAVDRYTGRLYGIAAEAALAAADPMAVCPLSPIARGLLQTPTWVLLDAMCLAILGDDVGASGLFDRVRSKGEVRGFDIGLAERVSSAAGAGRRGANPEWNEVPALTAWRIGLASAAGLALPENLLAAATPAQKAWMVRLPGQDIALRAGFAPAAASTGAVSSAELDRILAAEAATLNPAQAGSSPGGQLRTAAIAADPADRLAAMKALWSRAPADTPEHYGWQLATAAAAARLPASAEMAADAPDIAASLVAAGITAPAARWWGAAADADETARARLWATIVAVAPGVPVENGLFERWAGTVSPHRAALLAAGLEGLGRGQAGPAVEPISNEWTRALDRAVAARRTGEVMVLAATGLRGSWREVSPDYLRRIAAALTSLGHAAEARLIVAEAAVRG